MMLPTKLGVAFAKMPTTIAITAYRSSWPADFTFSASPAAVKYLKAARMMKMIATRIRK